jgi:hypothetical protein
MTHSELRSRFDGYFFTGTGNFALVCSSAHRVTLFSTLDIAKEAKYANCGRGCDKYASPHVGYTLEPPIQSQRGMSRAFRKWIEAE